MAAADTTPGACARGCLTCSNPLPEQRGRGRPRIYCSACRPKGVPRYVKLPLPQSATCRHCANEFSPKSRISVYCSDQCRHASLLSRARGKRTNQPRHKSGHCFGCGSPFSRTTLSHDDNAKYCSHPCFFDAQSRVAVERSALARIGKRPLPVRPYRRAVVDEIAALVRIAKRKERAPLRRSACRDCDTFLITGRHKSKRCLACSVARRSSSRAAYRAKYRKTEAFKAIRRIGKAKRRAVERGAKAERIDPIAVFRRDKWRCKLCGCKTPASLRGTYEPNAPELDHVQSLADGGEHTWVNVQCACRACNLEKGARSLGQFHLPFAA